MGHWLPWKPRTICKSKCIFTPLIMMYSYQYNALPISHGQFSSNKSRKTPITRSFGCLSWVRNLAQVFPLKLLYFWQYRFISYRDISRFCSTATAIANIPHTIYSTLSNNKSHWGYYCRDDILSPGINISVPRRSLNIAFSWLYLAVIYLFMDLAG